MQHQDSKPPLIPAGTLERVSTYMQKAAGFGLTTQASLTDRAAEAYGLTIVRRWQIAESGRKRESRTLEAIVAAAETGEIRALLVPSHSRWARNALRAATYRERLRMAGCRLYYETMQTEDN